MSENLLQIAHRIKSMTNYSISTQQTEYVLRCMIAILRFEQNQQFSRQLKAHSQMQDGVNSCWKKELAIRAWVACILMDITWVSDV